MTYRFCGCLLVAAAFSVCAAAAARQTIVLDGQWQIEESVEASTPPSSFTHKVQVPGLANLASPAFADADGFDSREVIMNRVRQGRLPKDAVVPANQGNPLQKRNYFWYRTTFRAPAKRAAAILRVNKAQFGTAVWVNGTKAGEHTGCFNAGVFDVTAATRWDSDNDLLVRVGAHPAVLPVAVMSGTDNEKIKWTPGIYDSVSIAFMDNPVIDTVQVAPRISDSTITVETVLRNTGKVPVETTVGQRVLEWKSGRVAATLPAEKVLLKPGESKPVRQSLKIPGAAFWTPEAPFLYKLETATTGDSLSTRFGMREFRFDPATKRAMLNGKPYFLRGSNITLHRFFEDPACKRLPWDEAWVRKLLIDLPRKLNWNSFRFCIGPVPDKWLDIADEAGLLIQNEYFIWTGGAGWSSWRSEWDMSLLTEHVKGWMRDNWNHPSVAMWDLSNETYAPVLAEKVLPAVRGLDLSRRPWDNGYNFPQSPEDFVEDHPYSHSQGWRAGRPPFQMTELERGTGSRRPLDPHPAANALVMNEYGWLWLNRDGSPTVLTERVYEHLVGPNGTPAQRFWWNAYLLGGKTEYWRAHRNYAGILHFVFLTCSYPGVYTSDHFTDVTKLTLEPNFLDWVGEAFKPLGVYINFWQPSLKSGSRRKYAVMMVNDLNDTSAGKLTLGFETRDGRRSPGAEVAFGIPSNGSHTFEIELAAPAETGEYMLVARAASSKGETKSRRLVRIE